MGKYYHYTSFKNLDNIIQNGLIPQTGFRCYSIKDNNCKVFLSKGIDRSIEMYSLMLSYYEKFIGYEGDKMIQDNIIEIQELNRKFPSYQIINKINECNSEIQRASMVRRCRNFDEYLGGNCCFLSVNGIEADGERSPDDCYYSEIISPRNINLVNIRDKNTNYYICDLKAVLSYFMYLFPKEYMLKIVSDESIDSIIKLYKCRDESCYAYFNPDNYELEEIPLYQLNKTLTYH